MPSHTPRTVPALADGVRAVGLEQAARLAREIGDEEVVLVVLAHLADVGAAEELEANLAARSRSGDGVRGRCLGGRAAVRSAVRS